MFLLPSKRPYKRKGSSRISSSSTSSSSISRRHHSSFSYIDTSKYSEDIDEDDEDLIDIRDPGASSSPVFQSSTVPVDADVDLIVFGSDPDRGENEKILCIDNDGPMWGYHISFLSERWERFWRGRKTIRVRLLLRKIKCHKNYFTYKHSFELELTWTLSMFYTH